MQGALLLRGKSILITRSAHQAGELVRLVEEHGGIPVVFPTIEIRMPESWEGCDHALDSLYMYDGLIFTSVNGVEYFFRRLGEQRHDTNELRQKSVCVVGERTRHAVEKAGLTVTAMPERFTSADLSAKLRTEDLHGKTFLFPRGNLGKDILADNLRILGASVDSIIVYRTVRPEDANVDALRSRLQSHGIDVMTFASPSAFQNFLLVFSKEELQGYCENASIAVIGPVTARLVEECGFHVDIMPQTSTSESLVDAIAEHLKKSSTHE